MKSKLKSIIWLVVAILALWLFMSGVDMENLKSAIKSLQWKWASGAVLIYFVSQTLLAGRWVILLKVHGVSISLYQAIKLTYLGLFYNNMMPGSVGGDLLKGWYITHHSEKGKRLEAVVTVFVDRLVGLIGMILVAAIASLCIGPELSYEGIQIRWVVWGIFLLMVGVAIIFLSRRTRRALMISQILNKLPVAQKLAEVDNSIRIYRSHTSTLFKALILTVILQGGAVISVYFLTQALGFTNVSFMQCLIIMPIVWVIAAAIPVPGGLGIIENMIKYLFALVINPENPSQAYASAIALALCYRVLICFCSIPGGLVPFFGGHLPNQKEMKESMMENAS